MSLVAFWITFPACHTCPVSGRAARQLVRWCLRIGSRSCLANIFQTPPRCAPKWVFMLLSNHPHRCNPPRRCRCSTAPSKVFGHFRAAEQLPPLGQVGIYMCSISLFLSRMRLGRTILMWSLTPSFCAPSHVLWFYRRTSKPFTNVITWKDLRASELTRKWNKSFLIQVRSS